MRPLTENFEYDYHFDQQKRTTCGARLPFLGVFRQSSDQH